MDLVISDQSKGGILDREKDQSEEVIRDIRGTIQDDIQKIAARGGSFFNQASDVRSASRSVIGPTNSASNVGFRPARTLPIGPLPLDPTREAGRK
jgi:hypothetical protein